MSTMPFIIAISGTSGTGKTTLARNLVERLDDVVCLHTDEFADETSFPAEPEKWYKEGADLDVIDTPRLVECLSKLSAGLSAEGPDGKDQIEPHRIVVVDEHFGRMRKQVADFFDLVIYIEAPLEVSLARGIRRMIEVGSELEHSAEESLAFIERFIDNYLDRSWREVYRFNKERVRPTCDLILDGLKNPDVLVDEVVKIVAARLPE